jgi:hypothetical protein
VTRIKYYISYYDDGERKTSAILISNVLPLVGDIVKYGGLLYEVTHRVFRGESPVALVARQTYLREYD